MIDILQALHSRAGADHSTRLIGPQGVSEVWVDGVHAACVSSDKDSTITDDRRESDWLADVHPPCQADLWRTATVITTAQFRVAPIQAPSVVRCATTHAGQYRD